MKQGDYCVVCVKNEPKLMRFAVTTALGVLVTKPDGSGPKTVEAGQVIALERQPGDK